MGSKYPRNNPLSQKLRLTEDLYSSLTTNNLMQPTDRIEGQDSYNVEIDSKTEEDYLRNSIKMTGMQPAIDMKDIDLGSKNAVNDFYSHFKILNSVVQQNQARHCPDSTYTRMLKSMSSKKLLPLKMNIVGTS